MDLIILGIYSLVQGVRENITASKQENTEYPFDSEGVSPSGHVISSAILNYLFAKNGKEVVQ